MRSNCLLTNTKVHLYSLFSLSLSQAEWSFPETTRRVTSQQTTAEAVVRTSRLLRSQTVGRCAEMQNEGRSSR